MIIIDTINRSYIIWRLPVCPFIVLTKDPSSVLQIFIVPSSELDATSVKVG
jgi:hypothetical protein